MQARRPTTLSKRDSNRGVFLWNLRNFEEYLLQNTTGRLLIIVILVFQWRWYTYIFVKFQHYSLLIYNSFIMYSRLSILQTPNITKTLILRTEVHLPLFYSNESLINPFCITNVPYSELSLLRTIFSLLLTKDTSI